MRQKLLKAGLVAKPVQVLTQQQLRLRLTWASLIKLVYEVDPLKCPKPALGSAGGAGGR